MKQRDLYINEISGEIAMDSVITIKNKTYRIGYLHAFGSSNIANIGNITSVSMVNLKSGVTWNVYVTRKADGKFYGAGLMSFGK